MFRLHVAVLLVAIAWPAPALAQSGFAGQWETTYGLMTLTQEGDAVHGYYVMGGVRCTLAGKVDKLKLTFTYEEPGTHGEGWFQLAADGKSFAGKWREQGNTAWSEWVGRRVTAEAPAAATFSGLWETSFGRMRLLQSGDTVSGMYAYAGGSSLSGRLKDKRLAFTYKEPDAAGEGWFELGTDRRSFTGQWKAAGSSEWSEWTGQRVAPRPGVKWLVILEARWEGSLEEQEYSFGEMLRAFFARSPWVQVRHRYFSDEAGFKRWCGELAYLAEPAVLVVASHGSGKGISVDGQTIGPQAIAAGVRYARTLQLLHFSSCQIMENRVGHDLRAALGKEACPISGYTKPADWAGSAVLEFTYLDMILGRGMNPAEAAEQVRKLIAFASDADVPGAAIKGLGFRLLPPEGK